eukprot:gene5917-8161_t
MIADGSDNAANFKEKSKVQSCIKEKAEEEKCVVAQYRTTLQQKNEFAEFLHNQDKTAIPIEWVIDIADESNGWFYGTAYHFDDTTNMLHVMVPDKLNPSFDGKVLLDHRTVHLIECVDGKTDALFNKIVRDSVIKVKWDVEWFEEEPELPATNPNDGNSPNGGTWISSSARYYIRMANQLLVEDKDFGQETRGFVILTCDLNLKLVNCNKNRGIEDFNRLINENIVLSTPETAEAARVSVSSPGASTQLGLAEGERWANKGDNRSKLNGAQPAAEKDGISLRKLSDMARGLRENINDLLDDREKSKKESVEVVKLFESFALNGDLDCGLKLVERCAQVRVKIENRESVTDKEDQDDDKIEVTAEDTWYLAQKIEKTTAKLFKSGGENVSPSAEEEIEHLKRSLKKVKKELEDKEKELSSFKRGN